MDPTFLRSGLEQIAADLTVAGEPVAFDVVVERHLPLFLQARAAGLRVPSIAKLLAQAGAKRPDGAPFSADQLRASLSRATRRQAAVTVDVLPAHASQLTSVPLRAPPLRPAQAERDHPAPTSKAMTPPSTSSEEMTIGSDLDLSAAELLAARERLRRL